MMSEMKDLTLPGEQAADSRETVAAGSGIGAGLLLAVDSATAVMSVALVKKGKTLAKINSLVERNHSVYLLPAIMEVLGDLGLGPRNLQGIAVGRGPGSYTGVRIGVTAAKTMAWALKVPVAGVSSLEALAAGALKAWLDGPEEGDRDEQPLGAEYGARAASGTESAEGGRPGNAPHGLRHIWIVPMLNARRGQVFTGLLTLCREPVVPAVRREEERPAMWPVAEAGWRRRAEDGIRLMESWTDELLELARQESEPPDAVLFAGETKEFGAAIGRFAGEADWGPGTVPAVDLPCDIQAEYIGYLGALRLMSGQGDEPHTLLPNYTQLTEAEVKLARKQRGN